MNRPEPNLDVYIAAILETSTKDYATKKSRFKLALEHAGKESLTEYEYLFEGLIQFYRYNGYESFSYLQQSLDLYEKGLEISPENYLILTEKAYALMGIEDLITGEQILSSVLDTWPTYVRAISILGHIKLRQQLPQQGLTYFEKALSISNDFMCAVCGKVHALRMLGRIGEAGDIVQNALKSQENNKHLIYAYGLLLMEKGEYNDAKSNFKHVLEMDSEDVPCIFLLAVLYARELSYKQSFDLLSRIEGVDSKFMPAQVLLASIEKKLGKQQQRSNSVLSKLRKNQDPSLSVVWGKIFLDYYEGIIALKHNKNVLAKKHFTSAVNHLRDFQKVPTFPFSVKSAEYMIQDRLGLVGKVLHALGSS